MSTHLFNVKRRKVMQDRGLGLRWYWAFQAFMGGDSWSHPQATRGAAISEAMDNLQRHTTDKPAPLGTITASQAASVPQMA